MNEHWEQVFGSVIGVDVKSYRYDWVIKNYGSRYRNIPEKLIEPPPIVFDVDPETEWLLRLVHHDEDEDFLTLYLKKGTLSSKNFCVELLFFKENDENNVIKSNKLKFDVVIYAGDAIVNFLFLDYKLISGDSPDGCTITIRFQISFYFLNLNSTKKRKSELPTLDGLEKLFVDKEYCDAQIIVDSQVLDVHKCILCSRSAYFSAEFKKCWNETRENKVAVTDVRYEVMQEILRFIYTAKVDNLDALKVELFIAADKYLIEDLKVLCEDALIEDLKIENIFDTLILTNQYELNDLKIAALRFFKVFKKEIIMSDEYKTVVKCLPVQILTDLIEQ